MNYLLFGGDTTGTVWAWNLSLKNSERPVCRINAGTDIITDIVIIDRYLFNVCQDKTAHCVSIKGLRKKKPLMADDDIESLGTMEIYQDSEYPLLSVTKNWRTKELIFGSRKCIMYERNHLVTMKHSFGKYVHLAPRKERPGSPRKKGKHTPKTPSSISTTSLSSYPSKSKVSRKRKQSVTSRANKYVLSGDCDAEKAYHKAALWFIIYLGRNHIRIRSRKTGKYLRMTRKGTQLDCEGTDDPRETDNVFKWDHKKKTIQSVKYKDCFVGVRKKDSTVIAVPEKKMKKDISVQFELVEVEKNKKFASFFDFMQEPPADLDRICNLKSRRDKRTKKHLLSVQRTDINNVKIFDLNDNVFVKRCKIKDCQCKGKDQQHIFRIYDSGLSFDQRYSILAVGIFMRSQSKKAVDFSLKGLNISKTNKKQQSHSFCSAI